MKQVLVSTRSVTVRIRELLDAAVIACEIRNSEFTLEGEPPFMTDLWVWNDANYDPARSFIEAWGRSKKRRLQGHILT